MKGEANVNIKHVIVFKKYNSQNILKLKIKIIMMVCLAIREK